MVMAPFIEHGEAEFARTLEVNLLGTAWLMSLCAPAMARRGYGRIVAIASEWGQIGWPNATAYAATKGGIIALVKSVARQYAREGVAVNAVAPGVTDTPQLDVDAADAGLTHEEMVQTYGRDVPLGRIGRPEDIAATVAFLLVHPRDRVRRPRAGAQRRLDAHLNARSRRGLRMHDVIVIGGGLSGGLPAAAYLQKAGLDVLIIEANSELGCFCCTHETWPQTLDSPHVGVSFAGNSPVIADLDLETYGFRFRASPVILGTTYLDGTNCLICQDPARTAENFAKHSAHDGERMLGIQERVHETMVEFNELSSFSPHPDPSKLDRVFALCAYALGYSVDEMSEMTGPELCERTFESDACRQILMTPVAFWEHGAPFARGQGAYGVAFALYYTTGIGLGGNEALVDALTQCFLEHGGSILTNCVVDRIVVQDGRATGVVLSERSLHPGAQIDARVGVISNAGVPETLRLVGEQAVSAADARLGAKMRHWKMGLRGSHVTSWLLDGRIEWGSEDFDPLVHEAILLYRAFDSWEGTKRYMVDMLGNDTWKASGQLMEFTYYAPADPTSVSPEGHTILRAEECFPYGAAWPRRTRGVGRADPPRAAGGAQRDDGAPRPRLGRARARPVRVDAAGQLAAQPSRQVRPGRRRRLLRGSVDPGPDALPDAVPRALHEQRRLAGGPELDGRRLQRGPGRGRGRRRAPPTLVEVAAGGVVHCENLDRLHGAAGARPRSPQRRRDGDAPWTTATTSRSSAQARTASPPPPTSRRAGARVIVLEARFERGGTLASDDYSTPFTYNLAQLLLPAGRTRRPTATSAWPTTRWPSSTPEVAFAATIDGETLTVRRGGVGSRHRARGRCSPRPSHVVAPLLYRPAAEAEDDARRRPAAGVADARQLARPDGAPTSGARSSSATPARWPASPPATCRSARSAPSAWRGCSSRRWPPAGASPWPTACSAWPRVPARAAWSRPAWSRSSPPGRAGPCGSPTAGGCGPGRSYPRWTPSARSASCSAQTPPGRR